MLLFVCVFDLANKQTLIQIALSANKRFSFCLFCLSGHSKTVTFSLFLTSNHFATHDSHTTHFEFDDSENEV